MISIPLWRRMATVETNRSRKISEVTLPFLSVFSSTFSVTFTTRPLTSIGLPSSSVSRRVPIMPDAINIAMCPFFKGMTGCFNSPKPRVGLSRSNHSFEECSPRFCVASTISSGCQSMREKRMGCPPDPLSVAGSNVYKGSSTSTNIGGSTSAHACT